MIGLSEARATTTGDPGDSEFGPPPAWFTQQRDPIVAPEVPERNVPGNGATIPTAGDDDPEPLFPPLGPFARDTNGNGAHFSAFSEKHEPRIESAAADRVSELEAEMNRLLGQLSADHRSP
jgi:hypothetical protein